MTLPALDAVRQPGSAAAMSIVLAVLLAAQTGAAGAGDEVVVTGSRDGTLDLRRLRAAQIAFDEGRDTFAPAARLFFDLNIADAAPPRLALRSDDGRTLDIRVGAGGRFELPAVPEGRWTLFHDRGRTPMAVRVRVFSPGTDEGDRRLGDLRLQCRAVWQLQRGTVSLFQRATFATMGGCDGTRMAIYFHTARPIETAEAFPVGGGFPIRLDVPSDRLSYRAPLGTALLGNDARVRITFAP